MDLFTYDATLCVQMQAAELWGIDEAGRGPLAGPVCAAAVWIPPDVRLVGLDDSKKLTEKQRAALFPLILANCMYGVGWATPGEIDRVNILQATFLAMRRAYAQLRGLREKDPDLTVVDGNQNPALRSKTHMIVKGDAKSAAIAAASVVAKVTRDRYMCDLDQQNPQYQFSRHKGYPTKLHYELIETFGVGPEHRMSFLKKQMGG